MNAIAIAVVLLAAAEPVPARGQGTLAPETATARAEASDGWLSGMALREFRAGLGASAASGAIGVSPTAQFGVEIDPWDRIGFRLTVGTVLGAGSGEWSALELAPGVVFRAFGPGAPVTPYLAVGGQISFLTIDPASRSSARGAGALQAGGSGVGKLSSALSAAGGDSGGAPGSGGAMARISGAPEATAGVALRLTRDVALDVGVRYVLLTWQGTAHSGLTATVLVCAPLSF